MPPPPPILVVEDDVDLREFLLLALQSLGHQVTLAEPAPSESDRQWWPDAWLKEHPICLIDLLAADGLETLGLIRAAHDAGCAVIVMTGLGADAEPVRRAHAAGVSKILYKPFGLSALRQAVSDA